MKFKISIFQIKLKFSSQRHMQALDINKYNLLKKKKIKILYKSKKIINKNKLVILKTQTDKMVI